MRTAKSSSPCWLRIRRFNESRSAAEGLCASLPAGAIHIASGTYGIEPSARSKRHTRKRSKLWLPYPFLDGLTWPHPVSLGLVPAGPKKLSTECEPLLQAHGPTDLLRRYEAGVRERH